jgi:hypothetical protein
MGVSEMRGGKKGYFTQLPKISDEALKKMRGGRAVPSTGLSQFRGGSNGRMVGAGKGSDSESDSCDSDSSEEYEGGGKLVITHGGARGSEVLARESARRPAIRAGLSDQHSAEAKQMGQHLGSHLISVRGGGFFDLFTKGIVEAGQQSQSVAKQTDIPDASAPPPPSGVMTTTEPPADTGADMKGGALFYRKGDMARDKEAHHAEHTAVRRELNVIKPAVMRQDHSYLLEDRLPIKKVKGGYLSGPYEGMGDEGGKRRKGRPSHLARYAAKSNAELDHERMMTENEHYRRNPEHRADMMVSGFDAAPFPRRHHRRFPPAAGVNLTPPSSDDERGSGKLTIIHGGARSTRAAIVKKVMAEKGLKLIEASKYVKAHGLYKGGASCGGGPARRAKRASKTPEEKEHQKKMKHEAQMRMAEDALDEEDEGIRQRVGQPLRLEVAPSIPRPFARRAERGSGKKRRAPAGPSDGRRKRAEIVKKVMAEKGMKMIEASKYVKAHGLY